MFFITAKFFCCGVVFLLYDSSVIVICQEEVWSRNDTKVWLFLCVQNLWFCSQLLLAMMAVLRYSGIGS